MQKLSSDLKTLRSEDIDWRAEIEQTMQVCGWTRVELAEHLGLYVQYRTKSGGSVSPHLYALMRGKYKPKMYMLYALRYFRLMYPAEPIVVNPANPNPPEQSHDP